MLFGGNGELSSMKKVIAKKKHSGKTVRKFKLDMSQFIMPSSLPAEQALYLH